MSKVDNILSVFSQATAEEIERGKGWYPSAHAEACKLHPDPRIACSIVSVLSPGLRWERNIDAARRVINGDSLDGIGLRWYANVRKALRILGGEAPETVLGGNKVRSFYQCILFPLNPLFVCVDGHGYAVWKGERVSLMDTPNLTDKLYHRIAYAYTAAADRVGLLPLEVQAITWCVWRRIHGIEDNGNGHLTRGE